MIVIQLIGVAFITAIATLLLKSTKPELAFAVALAGGIILLLFALELLKGGISLLKEFAALSGIKSSLLKTILKMVGIGYLVEFSAGIITDFGQPSVADKLIFCGKITILLLAIPIFESVLSLITKLLGLL